MFVYILDNIDIETNARELLSPNDKTVKKLIYTY